MQDSIANTLDLLVDWFEEPTTTEQRANLLSKLATLELCGWLEGSFDTIVMEIDIRTLKDSKWIKESVIDTTMGFAYDKHFRKMLCILLGEVSMRSVEKRFDASAPGSVDRFKQLLKTLTKQRNDLAHTDLAFHVAAQKTIDAPSLSRQHYRDVHSLLSNFREALEPELQSVEKKLLAADKSGS